MFAHTGKKLVYWNLEGYRQCKSRVERWNAIVVLVVGYAFAGGSADQETEIGLRELERFSFRTNIVWEFGFLHGVDRD